MAVYDNYELYNPEAGDASQQSEEPSVNERVPTISIKGLHKAYGKKQVLRGLDLEVYEGELFGFI